MIIKIIQRRKVISNDDVVPQYIEKQRFGRFNVFIVLKKTNGYKIREDKLISVFSNKKDAQMFMSKRQGW